MALALPYPPGTPRQRFGTPQLPYTYYFTHYTTQFKFGLTSFCVCSGGANLLVLRGGYPLFFPASVRLACIRDPHPPNGTLTGPHLPGSYFAVSGNSVRPGDCWYYSHSEPWAPKGFVFNPQAVTPLRCPSSYN